jgi:coenzyme F420-reducing hydrogenase beta subunit
MESLDQVLLTDFWNWHLVLNSWGGPKGWQKIIIRPEQRRRIARSIIQATLWKVELSAVRSVQVFTAR